MTEGDMSIIQDGSPHEKHVFADLHKINPGFEDFNK